MQARTIGALLYLAAACQRGEAPEQSPSSITAASTRAAAEITASMHDFARWFTAGSIDSAAMQLTDDYHALPPNQPTLGKEGWAEDWTRTQAAQGRWTFQHTSDLVEVSGSLAVQRGRYTIAFEPRPGVPSSARAISDTGKFLWHWRNVDGRWLLAQAAWSSDLPATQQP